MPETQRSAEPRLEARQKRFRVAREKPDVDADDDIGSARRDAFRGEGAVAGQRADGLAGLHGSLDPIQHRRLDVRVAGVAAMAEGGHEIAGADEQSPDASIATIFSNRSIASRVSICTTRQSSSAAFC